MTKAYKQTTTLPVHRLHSLNSASPRQHVLHRTAATYGLDVYKMSVSINSRPPSTHPSLYIDTYWRGSISLQQKLCRTHFLVYILKCCSIYFLVYRLKLCTTHFPCHHLNCVLHIFLFSPFKIPHSYLNGN